MEKILGCKWMNEARSLPYGSAESKAKWDAHTVSCPPQHDDDNAECPHNASPSGICKCEVEDNLGWELHWTRRWVSYEANPGKHPAGRILTDSDGNYDICQDLNSQSFAVFCTDGTLIGEVDSLDEAKALAQREYAGIMIAMRGAKQ